MPNGLIATDFAGVIKRYRRNGSLNELDQTRKTYIQNIADAYAIPVSKVMDIYNFLRIDGMIDHQVEYDILLGDDED